MRFSRPGGDSGEADPAVTAALAAYATGAGSEHDALSAVAGSRLLVPVVAVLTQASETGSEKNSEMALPTLIGNDGRTAVIAFTGTEALKRWRPDARPVPVPAAGVCAAALSEHADAVVIDVAGPAPLVLEGARLHALADGQPPPLPHEDPDIQAEVAAVTPRFTLGPGEHDTDLLVTLPATDSAQARRAAEQIAIRLRGRLRRGIEVKTQALLAPLALFAFPLASGPPSRAVFPRRSSPAAPRSSVQTARRPPARSSGGAPFGSREIPRHA